MTNQFDSKGGEQNVGQGDHAIGQQNSLSTAGNESPAIVAGGNVAVNYGIPPALFAEYAGKLAVTESALASFFKIMEEQQVPPGDLDSKLREIAANYKELLARVGDDQAAKQAIERGDYAKAEQLLEDVANQHSLAAAEAHADLAKLQEVQLRYAKAAAYWQKAAAMLSEDQKKERSLYLHNAAFDFDRVSRYAEALPLYEQSLAIRREIGNRAGEWITLNNIATAAYAKRDYSTALKYLEQSLTICQEIGNKVAEGATLNNISQIYEARGNAPTALKYLKQSLTICQEIGNKKVEGVTLNNIGQIYRAQGDYTTALHYLEQSLIIAYDIDAKAEQAGTRWNIGLIYTDQGNLSKAEQHISCSVQLAEEIGMPVIEKYRKVLAALRAKLRGE
jgi:tetratricopeptide (TPR) repeat protein